MAKYGWETFGLHIPKIMVPKVGTDYSKWAVIACDQFTSEPEYWDEADAIVGDSVSTLRLMLPEILPSSSTLCVATVRMLPLVGLRSLSTPE